MKWQAKRGRIYKTFDGTARAHLHYWVRHNGVNDFTAGYYGFGGMDVTYTAHGTPIHFRTIGEAKRYCEAKDAAAVIITAVKA